MAWRRSAAVALVAVVVSWSGCGGSMQPDELKRSIDTLESSAAEGALLANGVARDRTKATFARVHAGDLSDTVDHEAEKLHDASAEGRVAFRKAAAVDLAGRISEALGTIQTAPDSSSEGRAAESTLTRLGNRAGRLAEGL